jgi:hypothetical protein
MRKTKLFMAAMAMMGMLFTGCPQEPGSDSKHADPARLVAKWELASEGRDFEIESTLDFTADVAVPAPVSLPNDERTHFTGKITYTNDMDYDVYWISEITATNNQKINGLLSSMGLTSFFAELKRVGDTLVFTVQGEAGATANGFFGGEYTKKTQ